jgi:pyridoxine/pyridoxamine 5'-phosphate oxidase
MTREDLVRFLQKHKLGVVATSSPSGEPQAAIVGIAVTDDLEIVFDTLDTTRKCRNLRKQPKTAFVIGWDQEITVQLEGVADEPRSEELARLKQTYFSVFPDGKEREAWDGMTYIRVRPTWARYSDFNTGEIVEFTQEQLSPAR